MCIYIGIYICICIYIYVYIYVCIYTYVYDPHVECQLPREHSIWGSEHTMVCAEYSLFSRALWQKRPMILRSLLIVATP